MSEKIEAWVSPKFALQAYSLSKRMPFGIHGDTSPDIKACYPVHTHMLYKSELPELFINATAFGIGDGANIINVIASGLLLDKRIRDEFFKEGYVELPTGMFEPDIIICMRKVDNKFMGVYKAYNEDDPSKYGYAQLYVKGDDHVLTDEYFTVKASSANATEQLETKPAN